MAIKPVHVLSDGNYRIAQADSGPPFLQYLDPKVQDWINVGVAPRPHFKAVESELAIQAGRAHSYKARLDAAEEENKSLALQVALLMTDLKEAKAEVSFLAALAKAEKYGNSFMQWRLKEKAA